MHHALLTVSIAACLLDSIAFGFVPTSSFNQPIVGNLRSSLDSRQRRVRVGFLSCKAQLDKTTAVGWIGRPSSAVSNVQDTDKRAEIRMSVTGGLKLDRENIKYDYLPGNSPVIVFLPALNQTRHGTKSTAIKTWCRRTGRSFLVADYFGMGQSSGEYRDACVSRWAADTAGLIDWLAAEHAHAGVVLVGAGAGGWVMLHAAMMRPAMVKGLVGVAADPDFTEAIVLPALSSDVKARIEREGVAEIEWGGKPYTLSRRLLEDGRKMQLLNGPPGSIKVDCPVRLIQGLGDEEIPPERQLDLSAALSGRNVVTTYVKAARHALDAGDADFRRIFAAVEDIERHNARAAWLTSMNNPV